MSKTNKILGLVLVIVVIFLAFRSGKNIDQPSKAVPTNKINQSGNKQGPRVNEANNVTVTVKPKILKVGGKPAFEVEFETHSVELDFDVAKQSYLIDDKGTRLTDGVWEGSPPGGHHRSGTLTFNTPLTQTSFIELIIKDVSDIPERKFKWNL